MRLSALSSRSSPFLVVICATSMTRHSMAWMTTTSSLPRDQKVRRSNNVRNAAWSATQLNMFDWLNPKKQNEPSDDKKDQSNDFFGNMMNSMSPPKAVETDNLKKLQEDDSEVEVVAPAQEKQEETVVTLSSASPSVADSVTTSSDDTSTASGDLAESSTSIRTGRVKWFNPKKGYGFIDSDDPHENDGKQIFVHQTAIQADGYFRNLLENEKVEYQLTKGDDDKTRAECVTGPGGVDVKAVAKQKMKEAGELES